MKGNRERTGYILNVVMALATATSLVACGVFAALYYKEHEEIPSIGFSPDADFPCIYAEKGLLSPFLIMDYSNFKDKDIILSDINCNNNPLNVVPKYCSCTISVKNNIDIDDVISFVRSVISSLDISSFSR